MNDETRKFLGERVDSEQSCKRTDEMLGEHADEDCPDCEGFWQDCGHITRVKFVDAPDDDVPGW